jgi:hypothetical protein
MFYSFWKGSVARTQKGVWSRRMLETVTFLDAGFIGLSVCFAI